MRRLRMLKGGESIAEKIAICAYAKVNQVFHSAVVAGALWWWWEINPFAVTLACLLVFYVLID